MFHTCTYACNANQSCKTTENRLHYHKLICTSAWIHHHIAKSSLGLTLLGEVGPLTGTCAASAALWVFWGTRYVSTRSSLHSAGPGATFTLSCKTHMNADCHKQIQIVIIVIIIWIKMVVISLSIIWICRKASWQCESMWNDSLNAQAMTRRAQPEARA